MGFTVDLAGNEVRELPANAAELGQRVQVVLREPGDPKGAIYLGSTVTMRRGDGTTLARGPLPVGLYADDHGYAYGIPWWRAPDGYGLLLTTVRGPDVRAYDQQTCVSLLRHPGGLGPAWQVEATAAPAGEDAWPVPAESEGGTAYRRAYAPSICERARLGTYIEELCLRDSDHEDVAIRRLWLWDLQGGRKRLLASSADYASADLRLLLASEADGGVEERWNALSADMRRLDHELRSAISPDGRHVVYVHGRELRIVSDLQPSDVPQ